MRNMRYHDIPKTLANSPEVRRLPSAPRALHCPAADAGRVCSHAVARHSGALGRLQETLYDGMKWRLSSTRLGLGETCLRRRAARGAAAAGREVATEPACCLLSAAPLS